MNYNKTKNQIIVSLVTFCWSFSSIRNLPFLIFLLLTLMIYLLHSFQIKDINPLQVNDTREKEVFLRGYTSWMIEVKKDTITYPKVVRPERDGALRLRAEVGKPIGPKIKYMPEWRAFGWFTAADRVEWDVEVREKGEYEVYLEWSVSNEEAGKSYVIEVGDQQLRGRVGRTGSWEKFKTEMIGYMHLTAGSQKIVFKPNTEFDKGALLDLRGLRLVPIK